MAEEETTGRNVALTLPLGALGAALALGLAAAAYTYLSGGNEEAADSGNSKSGSAKSKSGSMRRKLGLMTVITLLENDATRKVVLAVLKAMARRA
jgi:hypothetical protein